MTDQTERDRIITALYDARRPGLGGMTEAQAVGYMADAVVAALARAHQPAEQAAATDQAALRDRIAEVLVTTSREEWPYTPGQEKWDHHKYGDRPGHNYAISCALCTNDVDRLAAVLASDLPAPADRAAVLREAADVLDTLPADASSFDEAEHKYKGGAAAETLRRMADEAQQPETPAVPPVAYSGKGRAFCLTCPRPADEDVPLTANDIEPYECCAACGRDLRDVAEAQQPKES